MRSLSEVRDDLLLHVDSVLGDESRKVTQLSIDAGESAGALSLAVSVAADQEIRLPASLIDEAEYWGIAMKAIRAPFRGSFQQKVDRLRALNRRDLHSV